MFRLSIGIALLTGMGLHWATVARAGDAVMDSKAQQIKQLQEKPSYYVPPMAKPSYYVPPMAKPSYYVAPMVMPSYYVPPTYATTQPPVTVGDVVRGGGSIRSNLKEFYNDSIFGALRKARGR